MAYPKPLHTATINVERLVSDYLRSNKTDVEPPLTVEEVLDYVTSELAWHRKQSEYLLVGPKDSFPDWHRQIVHGVKEDGIFTTYAYISKPGSSRRHNNQIITQLGIELFSFETPVDGFKQVLENRVIEYCQSYRR